MKRIILPLILSACAAAVFPSGLMAQAESDPLARAEALRKSGDANSAIALLSEAQKQHPDDPRIASRLGYALIDAKRYEDAVAAFDHILSINPEDAMAYDGKAIAFDRAGNHLAAQDLYRKGLEFAPNSLRIRNNLGMSLILNGQLDQAIELLEDLEAHSDSKTVRQNLALAYGISGQKEKALALNLKDLPPTEAQENMRFYTHYATTHKLKKSPETIGFPDAPQR